MAPAWYREHTNPLDKPSMWVEKFQPVFFPYLLGLKYPHPVFPCVKFCSPASLLGVHVTPGSFSPWESLLCYGSVSVLGNAVQWKESMSKVSVLSSLSFPGCLPPPSYPDYQMPLLPCLSCLLHLSPSSRFLCFENTTPSQALSFTSFLSHQNSLSFRKAVLSVWKIFRSIPKKKLERWSSPLSTRLSLSTFVLSLFSLLKISSQERILIDHRWCLSSGRKDQSPSKGPMAVGLGSSVLGHLESLLSGCAGCLHSTEGPTFRTESTFPERHLLGRDRNSNSLCRVGTNRDCFPFRQESDRHRGFYWAWAQSVKSLFSGCFLPCFTPPHSSHALTAGVDPAGIGLWCGAFVFSATPPVRMDQKHRKHKVRHFFLV